MLSCEFEASDFCLCFTSTSDHVIDVYLREKGYKKLHFCPVSFLSEKIRDGTAGCGFGNPALLGLRETLYHWQDSEAHALPPKPERLRCSTGCVRVVH